MFENSLQGGLFYADLYRHRLRDADDKPHTGIDGICAGKRENVPSARYGGLYAVRDYFGSRDTLNGMTLAMLVLMLLTCNLSILLLIVSCIGVVRVLRGERAQSNDLTD